MNKYTYLLSDCYRNPSHIPSQKFNNSFSSFDNRHQSSNKSNRLDDPYSIHPDSRLAKLKQEYATFQTKNVMISPHPYAHTTNLLSLNKHKYQNLTQNLQNQNNQDSLRNRLHKLINLGQRHEQALKEVDLQSKLKKISDKYSGKQQKMIETDYQQYKKQRNESEFKRNGSNSQPSITRKIERSLTTKDQHKMYKEVSFSNLPQNQPCPKVYQQTQQNPFVQPPPRPAGNCYYEPENEITRTSVKAMINNHLSHAKRQNLSQMPQNPLKKSKIKINYEIPKSFTPQRRNIQNPLASKNSNEENIRSMQKLSQLQQRIKSSIKPYLNI